MVEKVVWLGTTSCRRNDLSDDEWALVDYDELTYARAREWITVFQAVNDMNVTRRRRVAPPSVMAGRL